MSSYNKFALVYDELTQNVEYEKRYAYIASFFNEHKLPRGAKILDLACGTGSLTKLLEKDGYKPTGVDLSEDMLTAAAMKCKNANFIKADMRRLSFSGEFDGCICCLDSLNHLESIKELEDAFRGVYEALKPGVLFIFDVNTVYKHNELLSDNSFVFDEESYFLAWDNEFIADGKVRIFLDLFIKAGEYYERYSEDFTETAFELSVIKSALSPYFDILGLYDDMSLKEPEKDSERVYFICRRK